MTLCHRLTLTQRLSLVFAALLLLCSGTSAWLQVRANHIHELEVVQSLSRDVAANIAHSAQLTDAHGLMPHAIHDFFHHLMNVNPSVEVYLLDPDGLIAGHAAPKGSVRRQRVSLEPIHQFLQNAPLPLLGDDPRSPNGQKIFSAAPLQVANRNVGYIYVVLQGEAYDQLLAQGSTHKVLNIALCLIALTAFLCLAAGLFAFTRITRPLRQLTTEVQQFDIHGTPPPASPLPLPPDQHNRNEIAVLHHAYRHMTARISEQWHILTRQDQERRELIANVSHDLRTPLASVHGYLETLLLKDTTLAPPERRRYLTIALNQSQKVSELVQSLFELTRLEHGFVHPQPEPFSLTDLIQDIYQKFELRAQARHIQLQAHIAPHIPSVHADLGMIERVFSNLIDNALHHTPDHGYILTTLTPLPDTHEIEITLCDNGPGIPPELRDTIFQRPFTLGGARRQGGLGLHIVHRILKLHGSTITLQPLPNQTGACFRFTLPTQTKREVRR